MLILKPVVGALPTKGLFSVTLRPTIEARRSRRPVNTSIDNYKKRGSLVLSYETQHPPRPRLELFIHSTRDATPNQLDLRNYVLPNHITTQQKRKRNDTTALLPSSALHRQEMGQTEIAGDPPQIPPSPIMQQTVQGAKVLRPALLTDSEIGEVFHLRACGLNTPEIAQLLGKPCHSVTGWVRIYDTGIREA